MATSKQTSHHSSEHEQMLEGLKQLKKRVTQNEGAALAFLIEIGVLTEKGNLKRNYRNLCIPAVQE